MSWYVIEGPDDTGKTTLAEELGRMGYRYEHADSTDTLPVLAQRMAKLQHLSSVVWDRAHLGEVVHGPGRGYAASSGWLRLIEAFLLERGVRAVLLTERRGTDFENSLLEHQLLQTLFERAAENSQLRWTGWGQPSPYPMDHVHYAFWDEYDKRIDPEGLGGLRNQTHQPLVWILGEQESSKTPVPWPFATRCGIDLVWPVVNPREVRVSNVLRRLPNQKLDAAYLYDRWAELGCPPVIALGNSVERWCLSAEVTVSTKLPHPQWHLRFKASEPEQYRYFLKMAILRAQREVRVGV